MRSDWELIRAYASDRSEGAFAEIVRRHGAMVYANCLRLLGEAHAAEDALQAVFMVLARKVRSLRHGVDLASWLYGVTRRVAMTAARKAARQARREEEAAMLRARRDFEGRQECRAETRQLLDRELARLPGGERQAVILRYLEGRSEAEAAAIGGCAVGTLSYRASRGLARLRERMKRRGLHPGAGGLTAMLAAEAAVQLPEGLLSSLTAIPRLAVAGVPGSGAGSASLLAKGAMKMMFWTKVKFAAAVAFGVLAAGAGGGSLAAKLLAGEPAVAAADGGSKTSENTPETELGRLAAGLKPGEMKELKTKGYTRELLKSWYEWDTIENGVRKYGAQHMFNIMTGNWSNDGKWDPKSRRILYFGGGHYAAFKFVTYSADSNTWKLMPVPPWCDPRIEKTSKEHGWHSSAWDKDKKTGKKYKTWPRGHTYDCQFLYPEKRLYGVVVWSRMRRYDLEKGEWLKSLTGFKGNSYGAAEAFPEAGGIVAFSRKNHLCLYDPDTGRKRALQEIGFGIHGVMEYNPVHKVVLVGGGDAGGDKGVKNLYLVDQSGKVKKLKPAPDWLRCTQDAKVMCDPVSGEYVVQGHRSRKSGKDVGKVWAFHPLKDEWKEIPGLRFPTGIAVPINTYGVIVICTGSKVCVYKHKPVFANEKAE